MKRHPHAKGEIECDAQGGFSVIREAGEKAEFVPDGFGCGVDIQTDLQVFRSVDDDGPQEAVVAVIENPAAVSEFSRNVTGEIDPAGGEPQAPG